MRERPYAPNPPYAPLYAGIRGLFAPPSQVLTRQGHWVGADTVGDLRTPDLRPDRASKAAATRAALFSGPSGISAYQNGFAVFQMPFAVIALSVMTAMLPRLSRNAARLDHRQITEDLSQAVRLAVVALASIAAANAVLGPQIATLLFACGRSSPPAIALLGAVVAAFGVALVPFTGYMILQRGFYAPSGHQASRADHHWCDRRRRVWLPLRPVVRR